MHGLTVHYCYSNENRWIEYTCNLLNLTLLFPNVLLCWYNVLSIVLIFLPIFRCFCITNCIDYSWLAKPLITIILLSTFFFTGCLTVTESFRKSIIPWKTNCLQWCVQSVALLESANNDGSIRRWRNMDLKTLHCKRMSPRSTLNSWTPKCLFVILKKNV
jgi:hypothetical protein